MSTEIDMKNLERKVDSLEILTKIAIGIVVGVTIVLGYTGANLFSDLRSAQSQLAEVVTKTSALKPVVDASIANIHDAATAEIQRIVVAAKESGVPVLVRPSSEGREIQGDLMDDSLRTTRSEQQTVVSFVDVMAAQNHAKETWKAAERSQCRNMRPQDWHRAQTVYQLGDQDKEMKKYSRALDEFKEARKFYESCLKGNV